MTLDDTEVRKAARFGEFDPGTGSYCQLCGEWMQYSATDEDDLCDDCYQTEDELEQ